MSKAPSTESFEQFMARALHDPLKGYYREGLATVGRGGDFSTSATLFPELGSAIAAWLKMRSDETEWKGPLDVVEVGGGTGQLMLSVLKALGWWSRRRFRFHAVEASSPLRACQQKLLKGYGVQWHNDMKAAMEACHGRAFIYSNELVDAFPCLVLAFQEGVWKELHLWREGAETKESWIFPEGARVGSILQNVGEDLPEAKPGLQIEIPWSYREWLETWLPLWKEGSQLTIDYGDTGENLLRLNRLGTRRAYFKHLRLEGDEIYRRVGSQDITFDVNFSLLEKWGKEFGLKTVCFQNQSAFLQEWNKGVAENSQAALAQAMFQVLEQRRFPDAQEAPK